MIYAVGLKGWVELRKAKVPPRTKETVAVTNVTLEGPFWHPHPNEDGYHCYREKRVVQKRLRGIVTSGGKFLTSMKCRKFSDVTRIHVLPGGVWEIPPEFIPKLLGSTKRPAKGG